MSDAGRTWLGHSLRDKVVHENADVAVRASEHELVERESRAPRVDARENALRGRLLVPRRAVDLAG